MSPFIRFFLSCISSNAFLISAVKADPDPELDSGVGCVTWSGLPSSGMEVWGEEEGVT